MPQRCENHGNDVTPCNVSCSYQDGQI